MEQSALEERLALQVDCRLCSVWTLVFLAQIRGARATILGSGLRLAYIRAYRGYALGQGNPLSLDDDQVDLELLDVWSQVSEGIRWSERNQSLLPMMLRLAYLRGWLDAGCERSLDAHENGSGSSPSPG